MVATSITTICGRILLLSMSSYSIALMIIICGLLHLCRPNVIVDSNTTILINRMKRSAHLDSDCSDCIHHGDCVDQPPGTAIHYADCSLIFIVCLPDGSQQQSQCPQGLVFDRQLQRCRPVWSVAECRLPQSLPTKSHGQQKKQEDEHVNSHEWNTLDNSARQQQYRQRQYQRLHSMTLGDIFGINMKQQREPEPFYPTDSDYPFHPPVLHDKRKPKKSRRSNKHHRKNGIDNNLTWHRINPHLNPSSYSHLHNNSSLRLHHSTEFELKYGNNQSSDSLAADFFKMAAEREHDQQYRSNTGSSLSERQRVVTIDLHGNYPILPSLTVRRPKYQSTETSHEIVTVANRKQHSSGETSSKEVPSFLSVSIMPTDYDKHHHRSSEDEYNNKELSTEVAPDEDTMHKFGHLTENDGADAKKTHHRRISKSSNEVNLADRQLSKTTVTYEEPSWATIAPAEERYETLTPIMRRPSTTTTIIQPMQPDYNERPIVSEKSHKSVDEKFNFLSEKQTNFLEKYLKQVLNVKEEDRSSERKTVMPVSGEVTVVDEDDNDHMHNFEHLSSNNHSNNENKSSSSLNKESEYVEQNFSNLKEQLGHSSKEYADKVGSDRHEEENSSETIMNTRPKAEKFINPNSSFIIGPEKSYENFDQISRPSTVAESSEKRIVDKDAKSMEKKEKIEEEEQFATSIKVPKPTSENQHYGREIDETTTNLPSQPSEPVLTSRQDLIEETNTFEHLSNSHNQEYHHSVTSSTPTNRPKWHTTIKLPVPLSDIRFEKERSHHNRKLPPTPTFESSRHPPTHPSINVAKSSAEQDQLLSPPPMSTNKFEPIKKPVDMPTFPIGPHLPLYLNTAENGHVLQQQLEHQKQSIVGSTKFPTLPLHPETSENIIKVANSEQHHVPAPDYMPDEERNYKTGRTDGDYDRQRIPMSLFGDGPDIDALQMSSTADESHHQSSNSRETLEIKHVEDRHLSNAIGELSDKSSIMQQRPEQISSIRVRERKPYYGPYEAHQIWQHHLRKPTKSPSFKPLLSHNSVKKDDEKTQKLSSKAPNLPLHTFEKTLPLAEHHMPSERRRYLSEEENDNYKSSSSMRTKSVIGQHRSTVNNDVDDRAPKLPPHTARVDKHLPNSPNNNEIDGSGGQLSSTLSHQHPSRLIRPKHLQWCQFKKSRKRTDGQRKSTKKTCESQVCNPVEFYSNKANEWTDHDNNTYTHWRLFIKNRVDLPICFIQLCVYPYDIDIVNVINLDPITESGSLRSMDWLNLRPRTALITDITIRTIDDSTPLSFGTADYRFCDNADSSIAAVDKQVLAALFEQKSNESCEQLLTSIHSQRQFRSDPMQQQKQSVNYFAVRSSLTHHLSSSSSYAALLPDTSNINYFQHHYNSEPHYPSSYLLHEPHQYRSHPRSKYLKSHPNLSPHIDIHNQVNSHQPPPIHDHHSHSHRSPHIPPKPPTVYHLHHLPTPYIKPIAHKHKPQTPAPEPEPKPVGEQHKYYQPNVPAKPIVITTPAHQPNAPPQPLPEPTPVPQMLNVPPKPIAETSPSQSVNIAPKPVSTIAPSPVPNYPPKPIKMMHSTQLPKIPLKPYTTVIPSPKPNIPPKPNKIMVPSAEPNFPIKPYTTVVPSPKPHIPIKPYHTIMASPRPNVPPKPIFKKVSTPLPPMPLKPSIVKRPRPPSPSLPLHHMQLSTHKPTPPNLPPHPTIKHFATPIPNLPLKPYKHHAKAVRQPHLPIHPIKIIDKQWSPPHLPPHPATKPPSPKPKSYDRSVHHKYSRSYRSD